MDSRFSLPACRVLLCGLIAPGPITAEAAGIGVHMRVHAQTIPRAVAGGMSAWERARRRTESEHEKYSARYSGRKYGDQIAQMSDQCKSFTSMAAPQGRM
jgi:hypothetical protein